MRHRVTDLWQHNRPTIVAFVIMLCVAGFFGFRSVSQFVYWSDPQHHDQALAGWMTPRYVARSYRVPPDVIQTALARDSDTLPRRISLEMLAAEKNLTIGALQERIDTAVAVWRAANPEAAP